MPSTIFSGTKVKTLKKILNLFNGVDIQSSTVDPTSIAVNSPVGSLLLNESNGQLYRKLDSGSSTNWVLVGGNLLGINLMEMNSTFQQTNATNANAEVSVGNWAAYADAAGTAPVDMTGGTPNSTITRTTSAINGSGSFLMTVNSGASRQGEGVSCLVNVPTAYRGQTLSIRFPFTTTGTLVEDDFRIFAYDVTNSTLITPTTFSKVLGASGQVYAQFPVSTNTAQVRVGIHIARTSTGAATITFDDVSLSNASVPVGMAGSDWLAYTPTFTGFGTVSTQNFRYRRVGDSVEIQGRFTFGTPTATEARLSLPLNLNIDSSIDTLELAGWAARNAVSTNYDFAVLAEPSVSYFTFGNSVGGSAAVLAKQNGNALGGSGNICSVQARIKVAGWSANVSVGESSSFFISSYLANGTRVTGTAPTKLGEYRSYLKNAGAATFTETNGTPNTLPSAANGILVYNGAAYNSGDSSGEPTKYEIFVGKNKVVKSNWYLSAGKTGFVDPRPYEESSSITTGYFENYDPVTGIYTIVANRYLGGTSTHKSGYGGDGVTTVNDIFCDVLVSENALSVSSQQPRSMVRLADGNGHGSTNTKIRRFSTTVQNIGTGITYADSATAGASFTINESGVYSISYTDRNNSIVNTFGISLNSNQLTTDISLITTANALSIVDASSGGFAVQVCWSGVLSAGDIIRPHTDGLQNNTGYGSKFTITKVSN